jgi:hypothetical protein
MYRGYSFYVSSIGVGHMYVCACMQLLPSRGPGLALALEQWPYYAPQRAHHHLSHRQRRLHRLHCQDIPIPTSCIQSDHVICSAYTVGTATLLVTAIVTLTRTLLDTPPFKQDGTDFLTW